MKTIEKRIQARLQDIVDGYTCVWNYKGTGINYITGANTLRFRIIDNNVTFQTVGYCDMLVDDFIEMMPSIMYRLIACQVKNKNN